MTELITHPNDFGNGFAANLNWLVSLDFGTVFTALAANPCCFVVQDGHADELTHLVHVLFSTQNHNPDGSVAEVVQHHVRVHTACTQFPDVTTLEAVFRFLLHHPVWWTGATRSAWGAIPDLLDGPPQYNP